MNRKEIQDRHRDKRLGQNRCITCGMPAVKGVRREFSRFCVDHRDIHRKNSRDYMYNRRHNA